MSHNCVRRWLLMLVSSARQRIDDPPAAAPSWTAWKWKWTHSQMVEELLELSRIESGRRRWFQPDVSRCRLADGRTLAAQAGNAHVSTCRYGSAAGLEAAADAADVLNLLHNAIKFSPAAMSPCGQTPSPYVGDRARCGHRHSRSRWRASLSDSIRLVVRLRRHRAGLAISSIVRPRRWIWSVEGEWASSTLPC